MDAPAKDVRFFGMYRTSRPRPLSFAGRTRARRWRSLSHVLRVPGVLRSRAATRDTLAVEFPTREKLMASSNIAGGGSPTHQICSSDALSLGMEHASLQLCLHRAGPGEGSMLGSYEPSGHEFASETVRLVGLRR